MGAMDWSFLVDHDGGGLEALKDPSRFSAPSLDDLLKGIDVDKLDLEMAMDDAESARYNNMIDNKSWRAVRHARVHNFNMLAKFEPGADLKKFSKSQSSRIQPKKLRQRRMRRAIKTVGRRPKSRTKVAKQLKERAIPQSRCPNRRAMQRPSQQTLVIPRTRLPSRTSLLLRSKILRKCRRTRR